MSYNDFKINFEENKKQLIEAYVLVLGEEYRDIITKNINNVVLIDYITNYQYQYYLRKNNIDTTTDSLLIEDEENKFKVYTDVNNEFINTISKLIPNNEIIISELGKYGKIKNYETPLFNSYLNEPYYSIKMKLEILENLGYHVNLKKPFSEFKTENENTIIDYWNNLFTEEETNIIVETAINLEEKLRIEYIYNTGNMGQKRQYYNSKNLLLKDFLDLITNHESGIVKCVFPNYSLIDNDVAPVIFFPTLGNIDRDYITSFIHELTHAVSTNLISNNNGKIKVKLGTLVFDNIVNDNENDVKESIMLNEAMTQYIAVLVTNVIFEHDLCPNLISFDIPEQRNVFESAYANVVTSFQNFFEENFEEVKQCYLGKSNLENIGKVSFDKLIEVANLVSKNKEMVNQIDLASYRTL